MNGTTRMHVKFLKAQYLSLRFWLHANSQYIITVWQRAVSCRNEYNKAIPYYEKATILCLDNEKADILYRMALCYMYSERYDVAYEYFSSSLAYYKHYGISAEKKQRIVQISNMMQGCKEKF